MKKENMYKDLEEAINLRHDQLVLTRCPNWCDEGYSVARWDADDKEFVNSAAPNNLFHKCVTGFVEIDSDGYTCKYR